MKIAAFLLMVLMTGCTAVSSPAFAAPKPSSSATLYGDVNQDSANKVIAQIQDANAQGGAEPIYLYINSRGGDILAGGMIVDAMAASRRPIYTVAIGQAASMAAVIHQYGAKRYMTPHAVLMFHNASMGGQDELPHMLQRVALVSRIFTGYEKHVAERIGIQIEQLRALEAEQWWLTADDAMLVGAVDAVALSWRYPVQ